MRRAVSIVVFVVGAAIYVTAARNRLSGFDVEKAAVGAADLEEMKEYSDKFEGRKGLLTLTKKTEILNPACGAPIAYTDAGFAELRAEIDRVLAAAAVKRLDCASRKSQHGGRLLVDGQAGWRDV